VLTPRPIGARPGHVAAKRAELRYELRKGGVRRTIWKQLLPLRRGLTGAAMVVTVKRVFVARYHRMATGCRLYAFSARSGKKLWSVSLRAVGPVAHSRWRNRVQLRVVGGHPTVFGHEGPGTSYIEQRHAATGKLLSHRKIKMPRP